MDVAYKYVAGSLPYPSHYPPHQGAHSLFPPIQCLRINLVTRRCQICKFFPALIIGAKVLTPVARV